VQDLIELVDEDESSFSQHCDIAFVPSEDSGSDNDSDSDEELLQEIQVPNGSYEHIRSLYTNSQKMLEPNHEYNWKDGDNKQMRCSIEESSIPYSIETVKHLYSKNSFELFQLFFLIK